MYEKRTLLKRFDEVYQTITPSSGSGMCEDSIIFTQAELNYCAHRPHCLGARFMIKECVFDYIESKSGNVKKNYREIEIINNEFKKPMIRLFNGIRECANRLHLKEILVSISHSRHWISGMVLFCY